MSRKKGKMGARVLPLHVVEKMFDARSGLTKFVLEQIKSLKPCRQNKRLTSYKLPEEVCRRFRMTVRIPSNGNGEEVDVLVDAGEVTVITKQSEHGDRVEIVAFELRPIKMAEAER